MTSPMHHPKSTLDALPKSFVSAMRTLFDVMDDKRTGYVRLADIEKRWRAENVSRELPSGVIDSLRKVTPANGHLSFERFCAGLRIALLRHDTNGRRLEPPCHNNNTKSSIVSRPASVPLPERENMIVRNNKPGTPVVGKVLHPSNSTERLPMSVLSPSVNSSRVNRHTATVRPNNVSLVQQRAISMPQLRTGVKTYQPPPKRDENQGWVGNNNKDVNKRAEPMDRNKVSLALEKWRMMKTYHLSKNDETNDLRTMRKIPPRSTASYPNLCNEPVSSSDVDSGVGLRPQDRGPAAKKASRRREPRRHTVANGIDYNMIKRLKLLEQEKDFLLQGLDVVERARSWYLKQIANVNDKLERVSKWDTPHSEYSMDAHQERLNFQMTRISEVNQHLNALMETSERGFPIHMNLAVHQRNIYDEQKTAIQTIQRLKDQNHALTEEIGKKSEAITQLESEKSALIRELFHARTYPKKDPNDTTLW